MSSMVFIVIGVVIAVAGAAILTKLFAGAPKKAKKGERAEIMRQLLAQSEHENSISAIASPPSRKLPSSARSDTSRRAPEQGPQRGPEQSQNSRRKQSATRPNSSTSRRPSRLDADIEAQIRQRAYELYQERGGVGGEPTDDWEQAKREVLSQKAKAATASS
jgi:phage repressor protein C with HTH and peptisase S24 domain